MRLYPGRSFRQLLPALLWPFLGAVGGVVLFIIILNAALSWIAATVIGGILGAIVSGQYVLRDVKTVSGRHQGWHPSTGQ